MSDHEAGNDTATAGRCIADGLNGLNFGVRDLTEERAHVIQVTSARAALCQLVIGTAGLVTWEYFPFDGRGTDPGQLTAIVASILGTGTARSPARSWVGPTLRGTVGRMLREAGLHVKLGGSSRNEEFCEVNADLIITSPARPGRGEVRLTEEAMIIWECPLAPPPAGLDAPGVVAAVGAALSQLQYPGHPGPAFTLATA